jgi:TRAP-type uncharacterized transport system substrate-binding protein
LLEAVAEMVRPPSFQATTTIQLQGFGGDLKFALSTDASLDMVGRVARGEVDIAILNPSAALTAAYLGKGPFAEPLPVRAVSVIPSTDWFFFAVTEATGLTSLAEIKARKYPLRVSVRPAPAGRPDIVHFYLNEILHWYGFSLHDVEDWGGRISYDRAIPAAPERSGKVKAGEIDAIFDEATNRFVPMLPELKMRLLPVDQPALEHLEGMGLHYSTMPRARFPVLPADLPSPDFSGWPLYTHAAASDDLIYGFCRAIDARKGAVPWVEPAPLPVADMCRDTPAGPLRVPLHPAAERYWREAGYL